MRTRSIIGAGLAVALAGAIWSHQSPASAQGWGMMGGYGPGYGHMGRSGGGQGVGPWDCPGLAANDGQGNGPGYHMRSWGGGPGWMMGRGYGRQGEAQDNLNLSTDDVKARMERWLNWRGNERLKVGDVKEKDADSITADIVTKDNSLVERFVVDRHTGSYRPSEN